jgi:hypothetical protein
MAAAGAIFALSAQALPTDQIADIQIKPVRCKYPRCFVAEKHGDVIATRGDGKKVTLGHDGMDAQLGPGGLVGWTTGRHVDTSAGMQFSNDHLVLYAGGARQAEFATEKGIIESWRFVDGAKRVATKSRGLHGAASVELFDIASRRRVAAIQAFEIKESSPAWVKPFRE